MENRRETVWRNLNQGQTYIIHITYDIDGNPAPPMETKGIYNNFIMSKDGTKRILNFTVNGNPYDVLVKYPDNKFYEIIEPEIEETDCAICGDANNEFSIQVCRDGHKFHIECFCNFAKSTKVSATQLMPTAVFQNGVQHIIDTGANFNVELKCPICNAAILPAVLDLCENYEGGKRYRNKFRRKSNKRRNSNKRRKSNKRRNSNKRRKTNKKRKTHRRSHKK